MRKERNTTPWYAMERVPNHCGPRARETLNTAHDPLVRVPLRTTP